MGRGMTILTIDTKQAVAETIRVTDEELFVLLTDGRTVSAPLAWYPRLVHASRPEREDWRLIGHGEGIHWPALDEDIQVASLLAGKPSGESQESLRRWLKGREQL